MKSTKFIFGVGAGLGLALMSSTVMAGDVYGPFPITLKGYDGDRTNSVSYSGQVGRQLLHNSLKKAVGSGASKDVMLGYFNGADGELPLLDPKSKEGFTVDVTDINTVSKTNLSGKAYKGSIPGWPGNMTGKEVLASMIDMAAGTEKGYDAQHGYDYAQLVSKFTMGGVFYHQACDNYLDEKMNADNKPNDKPYKDGAYYTGKEHSWDEAFGYWGAAAHGATLSPKQNYDITKKKNMRDADANGDGVVNLKSEMNYAHAYYAAGFDKGRQDQLLQHHHQGLHRRPSDHRRRQGREADRQAALRGQGPCQDRVLELGKGDRRGGLQICRFGLQQHRSRQGDDGRQHVDR